MEPFSTSLILLFLIPAMVIAAGSIVVGLQLRSHRKQLYAANRSRLSAELITMDEHIGFAEAAADEKRAPYVQQARLALTAAFATHNQYFGAETHKGVPIKNATMQVEQHLDAARQYLTEPKANSNAELIAAAKDLGRTVAQLAKVGTAKLLASGTQNINRLSQEYLSNN